MKFLRRIFAKFSRFFIFGTAYSLSAYLVILPHKIFIAHVDFLALIFRTFDHRRRRDLYANLNFVYPNLGHEECRALAKKCYRNFAFVILESLRVMSMPKTRHLARFSIKNEHFLRDALASGGGSCVIITAHYGYWEALVNVIPTHYADKNTASLGRLTQFPAINALLAISREKYGAAFIDKKGAVKKLLKMFGAGNVMCGILVDQNIALHEGVRVKFLGHDAAQTSIASVLSRRFGVGIVPAFCHMSEDYTHFEIEFFEAIFCEKSGDSSCDILEATQKQADIISAVIDANPSQWFWFHKRFKNTHGEIYS